MARLVNGLFGGFVGKIADVEGFIRNGVPFIRKKKRKTAVEPSLKRQITMKNMAVVNTFIDTMTAFVRLGFSLTAKDKPYSANNAAKSHQLKHALTGDFPDIAIDYPKVRLTEGDLKMPGGISAVREPNGIRFSWTYDPVVNWTDRRSRAMVLAHIPSTGKSYFFLMAACMDEESQFLELPEALDNQAIHAYISFVAEDQKQIGNSVYFDLTI